MAQEIEEAEGPETQGQRDLHKHYKSLLTSRSARLVTLIELSAPAPIIAKEAEMVGEAARGAYPEDWYQAVAAREHRQRLTSLGLCPAHANPVANAYGQCKVCIAEGEIAVAEGQTPSQA